MEISDVRHKEGGLQDSFGRVHDYLRISLTDKCNMRCFYCMPDEAYDSTPDPRLMQPDEIDTLAGIFVSLGVRKIRLTGGEPLLRKDAARIITSLGRHHIELALTTNGYYLHKVLGELLQAGLSSVNVSLDTLRADRFRYITRRDYYRQVRDNIELLLENGLRLKINVVVMRGINDDEIPDFIEWSRDRPLQIRFIEFMPFAGNRWSSSLVVTHQEILDTVSGSYRVEKIAAAAHDTARLYSVPGYAGSFAIISTMSMPFCASCNRMRLTADGKLKNCLFSSSETDLLGPLRRGEPVEPLIRDTVKAKAKALGGQLEGLFTSLDPAAIRNRSMIRIGG